MLSSVLRSVRAAEVNVTILRAFVRLRQLLLDRANFAARVGDLEQNLAVHDEFIAPVFEAISQLLLPATKERSERS